MDKKRANMRVAIRTTSTWRCRDCRAINTTTLSAKTCPKCGAAKPRYNSGDVVKARGETWRVIDRSDDEAGSVWVVAVKDPDRDAILHFSEIVDSEDEKR